MFSDPRPSLPCCWRYLQVRLTLLIPLTPYFTKRCRSLKTEYRRIRNWNADIGNDHLHHGVRLVWPDLAGEPWRSSHHAADPLRLHGLLRGLLLGKSVQAVQWEAVEVQHHLDGDPVSRNHGHDLPSHQQFRGILRIFYRGTHSYIMWKYVTFIERSCRFDLDCGRLLSLRCWR